MVFPTFQKKKVGGGRGEGEKLDKNGVRDSAKIVFNTLDKYLNRIFVNLNHSYYCFIYVMIDIYFNKENSQRTLI